MGSGSWSDFSLLWCIFPPRSIISRRLAIRNMYVFIPHPLRVVSTSVTGENVGKERTLFTFSLLSSCSSVGGRSLLLPLSSLRSSSQCLLYLLLSSLS